MPDLQPYSFIITASVRQAFYLRESLTHNCTIVSLSEFLESKVSMGESQASQSRGVLSDFEDREVWDQVIGRWERKSGNVLVNRAATARLAKQAFDMMVNYSLPDFDTESFYTPETRAMKTWMMDYQETIANKGWLTSTLRDAFVISEIIEGKIFLPDNVAFFGFHSPHVKISELLQWAVSQNIPHYRSQVCEPNVTGRTYPEITDEITACAKWARSLREKDPQKTIGIVVPEILKYKAYIKEIFDHVLAPESLSVPLHTSQRPYRLSIGEPIASYLPIKTFFSLFGLRLSTKFSFEDVSAFLRNPLIGGARQEWMARAKLEVQLRKLGAKKISWETLKRLANTQQYNGVSTAYYCPDLVERMNHHEAWLMQHGKGRFTYHDLVTIFQRTAEIWGILDLASHTEHGEVVEAFFGDEEGNGVLKDFRSLGKTLTSATLISAINKLKRIAQDSFFQPSSGSTHIQILSESDAVGIPFDAVWMLGLTANNWPTKTQPNPFILYDIQSEFNVPHADADQELDYAKSMTDVILRNAKESVMSCHVSEKGEAIRPSSIIPMYTDIVDFDADTVPFIQAGKTLASKAKRVTVIDNDAPALDMSKNIQGGTGLFKSQALCPFKGFVEHRLGVRALEVPEVGLSASLRGDVLHLIFEYFWKNIADHKALQGIELSGELDSYVAQSVNKALSAFATRKPDVFTPRIVEVESRRLSPLVAKWMRDYELPRIPFSNVEVETSHNVTIKGMSMKVKMDHRDVDSHTGALNIADNKSGQITPDDWFSNRLIEPQVPLYAIIESDGGNSIGSVVFKRIKHDEMSIKGVANNPDVYPKFRPRQDMTDVIDTWKLQIDELADEYQSGVANISPVKESKACTYCELKPTCRYHLI